MGLQQPRAGADTEAMEIPLGLKIPEVLKPFMAAYFREDAAAMASCFASDAEVWRVQQPLPLVGREAIEGWLLDFIPEFRRASVHRMRWFLSERAVLSVSELTMELRLLGEGKFLVTTAVAYELDAEGLIQRLRTFVDADGAVRMAQP